MEILTVENLNFTYPLCENKALKDISFTLQKGDFAIVTGMTGSGKSTLLRLLKPFLAPNGEKSGKILFHGVPLSDNVETACKIGFVMQKTEQQIVTDKVWHEISFGLENMGLPKDEIKRRTAETAGFFGLSDVFGDDVSSLSGGQKQLLNLAAVCAMQPEILILDEPTAQLDPIAASEFINILLKLNREMSVTVLVAEHRTEDLLPNANKLMVLENGKIKSFGNTRETVEKLRADSEFIGGLPSPVRLFSHLKTDMPCPLDIREGKIFLEENYKNTVKSFDKEKYNHSEKKALEFSDVCFRYSKYGAEILNNLSFSVYENEIFCILGSNGSGKTTALSCASGILKPYSGKIKVFGKKLKEYQNNSLYSNCLTMLPQDVQTVFLKNTVKEELEDAKADISLFPFDLSYLYDRHPYDISGGEQQLLALAKALAVKPKLLLLDEPTKGLDFNAKNKYISVLKELQKSGVTIVLVSHDVEFAAKCASRCALFFRGESVCEEEPREFFGKNNFYTTAANRIARDFYHGVTTVDDILKLIELNGGEVL